MFLAAVLAIPLAAGLVVPERAAAQQPWQCTHDGPYSGYFFQPGQGAGDPNWMLAVDSGSGAAYPVSSTAEALDAVGYNQLDGFFYGNVPGTDWLVRIDSDGQLWNVGTLPDPDPIGGELDYNGHWWGLYADGTWVEFDLDPGSGQQGQMVGQGTVSVPGGTTSTPGDWAFIESGPNGPGLYAVTNPATGSPRLVFFDTNSRSGFTDLGPVSGLPAVGENNYSAAFTDGTALYVYGADGNDVYRVDLGGPIATLLPDGPTATVNDGATCTDHRTGSLTVIKQVEGRNNEYDQFHFGVRDQHGNDLTSAVAGPGQDQAQTDTVPITPGVPYTIFDKLDNWWYPPDPWAYEQHLECRDETGNGFELFGGPEWNVVFPEAREYMCTIRNIGQGIPGMDLHKYPDPPVVIEAGETVRYFFDVVNTGQTTLYDIFVRDANTGEPVPCPVPAEGLPPWHALSCGPVDYTVTQEDIDRGYIENTAQADARDNLGRLIVADAWAYVDVIDASPQISVSKAAEPGTVSAAADEVTYRFIVTNNGTTTLTDIAIDEHGFTGTGTPPAASCPGGTLAPGASMECTATYTVTQADIDAGQIRNAATATATNLQGQPATSAPAEAEVTVDQAGQLAVAKTADPETVTQAGQQVTYTVRISNPGNTTLHNVQVEESAFSGHGTPGLLECPPDWDQSLAPGQERECTATYTVIQADIDQGGITNEVRAHGAESDGDQITSAPADAEVTVDQRTELSLVKSAMPDNPADFITGQEITYSYVIENTGNTTVSGTRINEVDFSGSGPSPEISCPPEAASLAPDAQVVCNASYTLTQADIDANQVSNTAHALATGPDGVAVSSNDASVTLTGEPTAGLQLEKSVDPLAVTAAGQEVTYRFTATNTGTTTLTGLQITENQFTGTGGPLEPDCPTDTLAPGESVTCAATYTVTQPDIDAGMVGNTATALATGPGGATAVSPPAESTLDVAAPASMELAKTARPSEAVAAGQQIEYEYLVTNTGETTLTGLGIDEGAFTGSGTPPVPVCPATSVAPGETVACTAYYTVTEEDIVAGGFGNTATATATHPATGEPLTSGEASAPVTTLDSGLAVTKAVSPGEAQAGEVVEYSFEVTNTGQTALFAIQIHEEEFTGSGGPIVVTCPSPTLVAGETMTCTASYVVTEEDAANGGVTNTAVATGQNAGGTVVTSPPADAELTVTDGSEPPGEAALDLAKTAEVTDVNDNGRNDPGDIIHWSMTVTNTGDTPVNSIEVNDPTAGGTNCPQDTLAPGESMTCTAEPYTITKQDAWRGRVTNTAVAIGVDPAGETVTSPEASATVSVKGHGHKPCKRHAMSTRPRP